MAATPPAGKLRAAARSAQVQVWQLRVVPSAALPQSFRRSYFRAVEHQKFRAAGIHRFRAPTNNDSEYIHYKENSNLNFRYMIVIIIVVLNSQHYYDNPEMPVELFRGTSAPPSAGRDVPQKSFRAVHFR